MCFVRPGIAGYKFKKLLGMLLKETEVLSRMQMTESCGWENMSEGPI